MVSARSTFPVRPGPKSALAIQRQLRLPEEFTDEAFVRTYRMGSRDGTLQFRFA